MASRLVRCLCIGSCLSCWLLHCDDLPAVHLLECARLGKILLPVLRGGASDSDPEAPLVPKGIPASQTIISLMSVCDLYASSCQMLTHKASVGHFKQIKGAAACTNDEFAVV